MLFGIPFSLIGSIFGAITGFIAKRSAMTAELQAAERKFQLEAMVAVQQANSAAINDEIKLLEAKAKYEEVVAKADPHRSTARRMIAYLLVLAVVAFPALVLFQPELQWFSIESVTKPGFLGFGRRTVVEVITAVGLPLVWLDGLLTFVSTVVGFYFGGSAAKFNNPYTKR